MGDDAGKRGGNVGIVTLFRPYFVIECALFRGSFWQFSTLFRRTFWSSKSIFGTTLKKLEVRYKNYFKIIFRLLRSVYLDFCGNVRPPEIILKLFRFFYGRSFFCCDIYMIKRGDCATDNQCENEINMCKQKRI